MSLWMLRVVATMETAWVMRNAARPMAASPVAALHQYKGPAINTTIQPYIVIINTTIQPYIVIINTTIQPYSNSNSNHNFLGQS